MADKLAKDVFKPITGLELPVSLSDPLAVLGAIPEDSVEEVSQSVAKVLLAMALNPDGERNKKTVTASSRAALEKTMRGLPVELRMYLKSYIAALNKAVKDIPVTERKKAKTLPELHPTADQLINGLLKEHSIPLSNALILALIHFSGKEDKEITVQDFYDLFNTEEGFSFEKFFNLKSTKSRRGIKDEAKSIFVKDNIITDTNGYQWNPDFLVKNGLGN